MRKQKMVRTYPNLYGSDELNKLLEDGWLVDICSVCDKHVEYIISKDIDLPPDDVDKYIL